MDQCISRMINEGYDIKVPPEVLNKSEAVVGEKGCNNIGIEFSNMGLCAIIQIESLRGMILRGRAVRRACYDVLRFVIESGANGCKIIVSGKLRAQRAKSIKYKDVYKISAGQQVKDYINSEVRYVFYRQGFLGIKVKIMHDWDPTYVCLCCRK